MSGVFSEVCVYLQRVWCLEREGRAAVCRLEEERERLRDQIARMRQRLVLLEHTLHRQRREHARIERFLRQTQSGHGRLASESLTLLGWVLYSVHSNPRSRHALRIARSRDEAADRMSTRPAHVIANKSPSKAISMMSSVTLPDTPATEMETSVAPSEDDVVKENSVPEEEEKNFSRTLSIRSRASSQNSVSSGKSKKEAECNETEMKLEDIFARVFTELPESNRAETATPRRGRMDAAKSPTKQPLRKKPQSAPPKKTLPRERPARTTSKPPLPRVFRQTNKPRDSVTSSSDKERGSAVSVSRGSSGQSGRKSSGKSRASSQSARETPTLKTRDTEVRDVATVQQRAEAVASPAKIEATIIPIKKKIPPPQPVKAPTPVKKAAQARAVKKTAIVAAKPSTRPVKTVPAAKSMPVKK